MSDENWDCSRVPYVARREDVVPMKLLLLRRRLLLRLLLHDVRLRRAYCFRASRVRGKVTFGFSCDPEDTPLGLLRRAADNETQDFTSVYNETMLPQQQGQGLQQRKQQTKHVYGAGGCYILKALNRHLYLTWRLASASLRSTRLL